MTRVSSARKQESSPKRGKTRIQCQARENNNPISSAEKQESGVKRGKTGVRRQARETGRQRHGRENRRAAKQPTGGRISMGRPDRLWFGFGRVQKS